MTNKQRNEIIKRVFDDLAVLGKAKEGDYASEEDTLLNFKQGATMCGTTKYEYWRVLFIKHVQSISNAITKNPDAPSTQCEPIEGRVMDAINYLVLLLCMMEDE